MTEVRYIETYQDGKVISRATFEVSDEELRAEIRAQKLANIVEELEKLEARVAELEKRIK